MSPLLPIGGAALLAYFLFRKKPYLVTPIPPNPKPNPDPPDVVPPPAPPNPSPFPDTQSQATVNAPSGLKLRAEPNENSTVFEVLPFNSWVAILDSNPAPPTPAAPVGWFNVLSPAGNEGWSSAEFIVFGTDKERRMTPEEEKAYHEHKSQAEEAIVTAGTTRRVHVNFVGKGRRHTRPNAPSVIRKCVAPNGCGNVPRGALVRVLRTIPGPKMSRRSPGMGGRSQILYGGQLSWVASEWLV